MMEKISVKKLKKLNIDDVLQIGDKKFKVVGKVVGKVVNDDGYPFDYEGFELVLTEIKNKSKPKTVDELKSYLANIKVEKFLLRYKEGEQLVEFYELKEKSIVLPKDFPSKNDVKFLDENKLKEIILTN